MMDVKVQAALNSYSREEFDEAMAPTKALYQEGNKRINGENPFDIIKSNPVFVVAALSGGLVATVRNKFAVSSIDKAAIKKYMAIRHAENAAIHREHLTAQDPESVVCQLTQNTFDAALTEQKYVVVDMYGVPCAPCEKLAALFLEAAKMYGENALFANINVYEASNISDRYNVRGVHTIIIFEEGKLIARKVGGMDQDTLFKFIRSNIEN